MKVKVLRDKCISAANCVAVAPDVFELDEEYKAVVLNPQAADDETLLQAAKSCPTKAIVLETDDGRQVYP